MRVSLINVNLVAQDAIGQAILHQLRFFRRRGDEVRIYTMHPPEGVADHVADVVHVVDPIDLIGRQDAFFRSSELYVYHYPGRYGLLDTMKSLDRGAVIFYYHNVTPPELWGAQKGREELMASQAAVSKLAPYADLVVTVSPFNAEELVQDHGVAAERIRVLPLTVPLDQFQPGPADPALAKQYGLLGKRVLLFVGRLAGNKRVDNLVEALARVRQEIDNAVLLVVGDHSSNPAFAEVMTGVRRRAEELGVNDAVIFTGRVPDLPPYYRLADVYTTASLHEGFGVPIVEAMASGVPVVASRTTAHPWVVGEAGRLVSPDDPTELADEVIELLQDDMRYGELVHRGLARAHEFSVEAFNAGWGKIVDEAADWLTDYPTRPLYLNPGAGRDRGTAAAQPELPLLDEIEALHKAAEEVIQPYEVRSGLPILGPVIAWFRRHLTSHLREPYLDPTLRRQERFNWLTVQTLRQTSRLLETLQTEQQIVEQRTQQVQPHTHSTAPAEDEGAVQEPEAAGEAGAEGSAAAGDGETGPVAPEENPAALDGALQTKLTRMEQQIDILLSAISELIDQAQQQQDPVGREAALAALRIRIATLRRQGPPAT